jgi:hypothetical protein
MVNWDDGTEEEHLAALHYVDASDVPKRRPLEGGKKPVLDVLRSHGSATFCLGIVMVGDWQNQISWRIRTTVQRAKRSSIVHRGGKNNVATFFRYCLFRFLLLFEGACARPGNIYREVHLLIIPQVKAAIKYDVL